MTVLTVEQLLSGSTLGLTSGLSDLLVLEIGGRKVLYALSRTENALIELDVAADGTLSMAGSSLLTGTFALGCRRPARSQRSKPVAWSNRCPWHSVGIDRDRDPGCTRRA